MAAGILPKPGTKIGPCKGACKHRDCAQTKADAASPCRFCYAKRYGLTVEDAVDGKEIPALVEAGDWDAVRSHIESDVRLTVELAQRLGVMRKVEVVA